MAPINDYLFLVQIDFIGLVTEVLTILIKYGLESTLQFHEKTLSSRLDFGALGLRRDFIIHAPSLLGWLHEFYMSLSR